MSADRGVIVLGNVPAMLSNRPPVQLLKEGLHRLIDDRLSKPENSADVENAKERVWDIFRTEVPKDESPFMEPVADIVLVAINAGVDPVQEASFFLREILASAEGPLRDFKTAYVRRHDLVLNTKLVMDILDGVVALFDPEALFRKRTGDAGDDIDAATDSGTKDLREACELFIGTVVLGLFDTLSTGQKARLFNGMQAGTGAAA